MKNKTEQCLEATLVARPVKSDYGVDGSPDWVEYEDIEIETAHLFGRDWSEKELRAEFGNLADWIINNAEVDNWE